VTSTTWKPIALLVLATAAAFALRVSVGRGVGYTTDMVHYVRWADEGARHPLGDAYLRTGSNYPPGALTLFWLVGKARATWPVLTRADNRYLSIKLPAIVGDLVTAWLVFLIAAHTVGRSPALGAAVFYLFNPAVISDSAHWGQSDGLVPIFPLLALYALQRNAYWAVGPCLAAALATKFQSVTLVATLLACLLVDVGLVRTVVNVAGGVLAFALIALPFALAGHFRTMVHAAYVGTLDAFPALRFGALNFWDVLDPAIPDDDYALFTVDGWPITPKVVGIALFALAWLAATLAGCARRDALGRAYALGLVGWAFFMFPTQIHERYLLPAIAFFTLAAARGRPLTVVVAATTSVIHLYSCYFRHSWGGHGIAETMDLLLLPIFAAAVYHLRSECLDQAGGDEPSGAPRLAGLARVVTARIWVSILVLGVASVGAGLVVTGWFHARTEVSLVGLGAYQTAPPTHLEVLYDRVPIGLAETKRFRFPDVFAALRGGVEVGGAEGGACLATFAVDGVAVDSWVSPPIPAGSGVRPLEVPLAVGTTDVTLSVKAPECPPGTTFEWVSPRLVPWRAAEGWGTDGVRYVSDLGLGARWPLSLLLGEGAWRRDRSIRGGAISIAGRRFVKGLGVQTDSVLSVRVPDGARTFATDVGYADDAGPLGTSGTIRFLVAIDGHEVYRSPNVAPGQRLDEVRVPVDGARDMTLVVESTTAAPGAFAVWGGARFLRDRGR
jgi:Gpi18-like mannosyltransferase